MKNKQPENPLKSMEEQFERILFIDGKVKNITNKVTKDNKKSALKSVSDMKKHLISLVKELKAKNLHLVA